MSLSKTRLRLVISVIATGLLAAGCGNIKLRAGNRVDVSALEQRLVMLQSTKADVRLMLGPPFGEGSSQMPTQLKAHTLWSYYYEEGTLSDDRRMFLFVYFNPDGLYDGYMWFSSLPEQSSSMVPTIKPALAATPAQRAYSSAMTWPVLQSDNIGAAGNPL